MTPPPHPRPGNCLRFLVNDLSAIYESQLPKAHKTIMNLRELQIRSPSLHLINVDFEVAEDRNKERRKERKWKGKGKKEKQKQQYLFLYP